MIETLKYWWCWTWRIGWKLKSVERAGAAPSAWDAIYCRRGFFVETWINEQTGEIRKVEV